MGISVQRSSRAIVDTILLATISLCVLAVDGIAQDPMPVLSSGWQRTTIKAPKTDNSTGGPARLLTADDKNFQRNAREQRTDNPLTPEKDSMEARSSAMDRAVQESRTPKREDVRGYLYSATVRNDSGKQVAVIYWEYLFTEIARPTNVVRRQFLCAAQLKKGSQTELTALSTLGPSDVIDAESLAQAKEKLFDERVLINRIEFSDDTILQRNGWKFDEVKPAVDRVTSSPWGKEICRAL